MTEYGRGPGSQPWHPDDPLYGDQGWGGHQTVAGQDPYAQDPYAQDPQDPYGSQGAYGQEPYGQDPYGHQQYPDGYQREPHPYQQQPQPQWNGQNGGYPQQDYAGGGWDGSYGGIDPHDPYGTGQGVPGGHGDYYAGQDGYQGQPHVPQQASAPGQAPQHTQPMPAVPQEHQVPRQTRRLQEPQEVQDPADDQGDQEAEDHPFFLNGSGPSGRVTADDEAEDDDRERTGKKGRSGKQPSRSGVACLFVTVVLVGAVGGGGYYAYDFWQTRFGPAPDYAGEGAGQVEVEIPGGSGNAQIGTILADKGVVKSSGAFVQAVEDSGKFVQPGSYTLRKEMSGAAAVKLMLDPASSNGLTVTEGMRDAAIYAAIDKKIGLKAGTTAGVAKKQVKSLGLPSWADDNAKIKDPLEGFLYPSRYSVATGAKPAEVLRKMVALAKQNYAKQDLEGKAEELGLKSPLQLITAASLVQAEGVTHDDFRKMSEVVYNRLKPGNTETNGKLEFDSTYNYIKNQSKIDIPINEIKKYNNPYNTYFYQGLPPGPIGNPGQDALKAAMNPTSDGWYYFISLDGKTSQFSKTYTEHQKWVDKFNKQRTNG
ncbi:endolytic transglycosylase MltG [Streptomyces sp. NPDC005322]|uniref:endolytic transglycosylase MltG n=1 Tax=Streptomyces sp. NPDC005322 TaxID=3157032 RepID=UPI0033B2A090